MQVICTLCTYGHQTLSYIPSAGVSPPRRRHPLCQPAFSTQPSGAFRVMQPAPNSACRGQFKPRTGPEMMPRAASFAVRLVAAMGAASRPGLQAAQAVQMQMQVPGDLAAGGAAGRETQCSIRKRDRMVQVCWLELASCTPTILANPETRWHLRAPCTSLQSTFSLSGLFRS